MRYFVNKLLTLCDYKRDCFQSLIDMNKLIKLPFYVLDINRTVDRLKVSYHDLKERLI